jgi:ESCRT-I complex subunit TSG101
MSSTETQKWLRQNVHPYPQKDRVYADVDSALTRFPTLRPKLDVYSSVTQLLLLCFFSLLTHPWTSTSAYDDGRTQLLLCVHGLLPISFRQASYNIPIALWLTRHYPKQPPIAYVVPTSDMLVKAGKYLDVSGRCNIAYMQSWERKSEVCAHGLSCPHHHQSN